MAGFHGCKWCFGSGCLACAGERKRWEEANIGRPIFTAQIDNPEEMAELKEIFSAPALNKAFGPEGGGIAEIERKSAMSMLKRELRKAFDSGESR